MKVSIKNGWILRQSSEWRRFATYLTGMGLSLLGSQAWFVALAWAASQLGDSRKMSWVMASASLPRAVLILPAGRLVDRWGARRVTLGSDAARAFIMAVAGIVLAISHPGLGLLLVVGALFGVIDALHMPALGSLPPRLLRPEKLAAGQGLVQTVQRAVSVVASPLGGVLVAIGGLVWILVMDVALFCLAFFILRSVPEDTQSTSVQFAAGDVRDGQGRAQSLKICSSRQSVMEGWRFAWVDVVIRGVLVTVTAMNLVLAGALNVGVAQLSHYQSWGPQGFGLLMAAFAAGAVIGALLISALPAAARPVRAGLVWTALGSATLGGIGCSTSQAAAIASTAALGITMGPASALLLGTVQARCPEVYLGRVMSLVGFSTVGLAPVSMILFGQAADFLGITLTFILASGLLALITFAALVNPQLRNATVQQGDTISGSSTASSAICEE
ncbi:Enterobactin exporter EntS [Austwickia sp. TVS 96-490-7B]|uniref:MFS transporter n=1 Tax=Austwickia sp. TVS 96-490-7B TaxID=2830843 RepID=UPI001C579A9D|nr:MFS transporter [Austwickia sp. TVS 96-490-7B]MBW3086787.1 Enterobactin exporter EntS [Austwickia sp. TVS 96-490-7B]